jgi:hypothetical protein
MVEDYAEDEIEYELAPVSAQLAYVQQVPKFGRFSCSQSLLGPVTCFWLQAIKFSICIFSYKDRLKKLWKHMLI